MDDLSPALRAQAFLHGTSHLQTDVGQVMAGGTHLLFKENGAARTPTGDPDFSRSTVAVLQLDSKLQSMLGAEQKIAGPIPTQSSLAALGQQKAELSPERHLH